MKILALSLIALVPLLPLSAAIGLPVARWLAERRGRPFAWQSERVALLALAASVSILLGIDVAALYQGAPGAVDWGIWFAAGRFYLPLAFALDPLGLTLATLLATAAFVALRFTNPLRLDEPHAANFLPAACLVVAAALLAVLSENAAMLLLAWLLAAASAYLLWHQAASEAASGFAVRLFIADYIGTLGFVFALALAYAWLGGIDWPTMGSAVPQLNGLAAGLLGLGFVLAAGAMAGLLPFTTWLLLPSGQGGQGVRVFATWPAYLGIVLLIRIEPILRQAPTLQALLIASGIASAVYGFLLGYGARPERAPMRDMGHLGLMCLLCGAGLTVPAVAYLGLHWAYRAYRMVPMAPYSPALTAVEARLTAAAHWLWQRVFRPDGSALSARVDAAWVRPIQTLAQDMRVIEAQIFNCRPDETEVAMHGEAGERLGGLGRAFNALATALYRIEASLLVDAEGRMTRVLRLLGVWLQALEELLEQPRYLLLIVAAVLAAAL